MIGILKILIPLIFINLIELIMESIKLCKTRPLFVRSLSYSFPFDFQCKKCPILRILIFRFSVWKIIIIIIIIVIRKTFAKFDMTAML